jgi:dTDP-4-amino-4,6-dideoxygalactose transaminase
VWKPLPLQPVFRVEGAPSDSELQNGDRRHPARVVGGEVALALFEQGLCLPSGTAMTREDLDRVVAVIEGVQAIADARRRPKQRMALS